MGTTISKKILVGLFIVGAVVEGVRHGATLMLLHNSLFAVGFAFELVPRTESSGVWPITRIISTTCILAGGLLLWYLVFTEP